MLPLHDDRRKIVQHLHIAEVAGPLAKGKQGFIRIGFKGTPEIPATSYPLSGKNEVEQEDATPTIAELEAQGVVSRGMPDKAKKRSGGRGE